MSANKEQTQLLEKANSMPLPPEFQKVLDASRGIFFGEVGAAFDKATQPIIILLKTVIMQATELKKENDELKTKAKATPNRAARRKADREKSKP